LFVRVSSLGADLALLVILVDSVLLLLLLWFLREREMKRIIHSSFVMVVAFFARYRLGTCARFGGRTQSLRFDLFCERGTRPKVREKEIKGREDRKKDFTTHIPASRVGKRNLIIESRKREALCVAI